MSEEEKFNLFIDTMQNVYQEYVRSMVRNAEYIGFNEYLERLRSA